MATLTAEQLLDVARNYLLLEVKQAWQLAHGPSDRPSAAQVATIRTQVEAAAPVLVERWKAGERAERALEARRGHRLEAQNWAERDVAARNALIKKVEIYLRSTAGRLGEDRDGITQAMDENVSMYQVEVVLEHLVRARAVRQDDEDGTYWIMKEWYRRTPGAKARSGSVQNIGTVPDAVTRHRDVTPAREAVARALSGHFYATRRSWAKARAIGHRELAKRAHVNRETVQLAVAWLEAEGLLAHDDGAGSRGRIYRWTQKTKTFKRTAMK